MSGTSACPVCGKDVPHQHSAQEVREWREVEAFANRSLADFYAMTKAALDGTYKPPIDCGCEAEDGTRPDPKCVFCGDPA